MSLLLAPYVVVTSATFDTGSDSGLLNWLGTPDLEPPCVVAGCSVSGVGFDAAVSDAADVANRRPIAEADTDVAPDADDGPKVTAGG